MSKYFIKERLFSIGAKFDVYDSNENPVYLVEADKFDIGKNINIYNADKGKRLLYMKQQIRLGAHKYLVYDHDMKELATIKKEFMVPEYNITGEIGNLNMESSSILGRHYTVRNGSIEIGKIDKEFTFGRDRYSLEVYDENYKIFLVCLLVMIDMVRFNSDN
ncbi:hypothetical protein JCM1393_00010 [Clostridium carnis]